MIAESEKKELFFRNVMTNQTQEIPATQITSDLLKLTGIRLGVSVDNAKFNIENGLNKFHPKGSFSFEQIRHNGLKFASLASHLSMKKVMELLFSC